MGCCAGKPVDRGPSEREKELAAAALVAPPFPKNHKLLDGLARALDLEYGPRKEVESVNTWVMLELEMRPKQHFDDFGTDLETATAWARAVEAAVKENAVTMAQLREVWGLAAKVVDLASVRVDEKGKAKIVKPTRADDDDSLDGDDPDPVDDGAAFGDGRYSNPLASAG